MSIGPRRPRRRPRGALPSLLAAGVLLAAVGCGGTPDPVPERPAGETSSATPAETERAAEGGFDEADGVLVAELRAADSALRQGEYPTAIEGYRTILARFRRTSSPTIESIRSSLMEAQKRAHLYDDALETSERILEGDASAPTIQRALKTRYEIGLGFLNGNTRRVLGLSVSAEGRGLEILDALIERYPFQSFAPDAVYHIASWYLRREEYAEAERLFQRLLRDYPASQWSATAEYRIGEAALKQLKGVEYDFGTLESAERRFKRYLKTNSAGDQAAKARENLAEIERLRARRWLEIAEFYIGFEKEDAARVYLRKLRETYPATSEGRKAATLLSGLGRPQGLGSGSDATP